MDDDARRRALQMGVNLAPVNSIRAIQVPEVVFGVNHLTGKVEPRAALGRGAEFTFLGENSLPVAASRLNSGALDFANGGPGIEVPRLPPPIERQAAGVDFLALDPNVQTRPGSDARDKRQPGPALFG